jgi:hypothetical protein
MHHGAKNNRRVSNGEQTHRLAGLAMKRGGSIDFTGIGSGSVQ